VALLGAGGEPVGAETARRLACDAGIVPAVLGSAGEPLDIGRLTRTVPTGMRRALHLRDRGCRFPGCDRPGHRCDAHHLRHWSRGGATSMQNLVLVCPFHHWLIHEGGWRVDYHTASNTLTAFRPDGGPYDLTSGPPGPGP
jgi:5-methylcytosine-specific restriction protein A